jgi:5'-nucleotidase
MPHILVTNDDGIGAAGLRALAAAMRTLGTVSIVAPSGERSATAQSITLRQPIACEQLADGEWAVEGTPADAVIVALNRLLTVPPDLVVSGINRGGNMGENIFYSGTVGAAAEATVHGVPALAISLVARDGEYRYEEAAAVARQLAELVLREGLPEGVLLNVNVPSPWNGCVRFTRQSRRITRNLLQEGTDPRGRRYFWLHDQRVADGLEPDTDYAAVQDGAVAITPLEIERTHLPSLNHLSHWAKELERSLHR